MTVLCACLCVNVHGCVSFYTACTLYKVVYCAVRRVNIEVFLPWLLFWLLRKAFAVPCCFHTDRLCTDKAYPHCIPTNREGDCEEDKRGGSGRETSTSGEGLATERAEREGMWK